MVCCWGRIEKERKRLRSHLFFLFSSQNSNSISQPPPPPPSSPAVSHLALYDVVGTEGVGADLGHIDTCARVTAHTGPEKLGDALFGADLVIIPAGVPRKPGMTRDDLFNINAGIVAGLAAGVARYCPKAWVRQGEERGRESGVREKREKERETEREGGGTRLFTRKTLKKTLKIFIQVAIISNPVNSTVPIAAEVLRRHGVYDPRKLLGVTTLDVVRARAFVAEAAGASPEGFRVPVVGGHAGVTILPLISQAATACGRRVSPGLSEEKIAALTARIQDAGTEVVTAKAGKGSATLSMAYAAFEFAKSCLRAMGGERGVVECAYVECLDSPVSGAPFFARPVVLGTQGVEEYLPLGPLSASEKQGLGKLAGELQSSIKKGVEFARTLK